MKKYFSLLTFLLCLVPGLDAETVQLKSGRHLEGEIIEKTPEHIQINSGQKVYKIPFKDMVQESALELQNLPEKVMVSAVPVQELKPEDPSPNILENNEPQTPAEKASPEKFQLIPHDDNKFLKNKKFNSIIHFQSGKSSEVKITRRVQGDIYLELVKGVEGSVLINGVDPVKTIETKVPDLLTNTYRNEKLGVILPGPRDWVMVTPEGFYKEALKWVEGQLVYFHKNPIEQTRMMGVMDPFVSLVIDKHPNKIQSVLDYANQRIDIYQKSGIEVKIIAPTMEEEINGEQWTKQEILLPQQNFRQVNYYLYRDKKIYWLSTGAPREEFETNRAVFEETVRGVEIRDAVANIL